jgi:hypothetical protein
MKKMTEEFIKTTIANYEALEDRARHIAEILKIGGEWTDSISFEDNEIAYVFGYTCWGESDYNYVFLPMKYMWMEDEDVIADYKAEQKRKEEEVAREKDLEEQRKKAAQEKDERTMYEKLKAKFENE